MSASVRTAYVFSPACDRVRPLLLLFSLYAFAAAAVLIVEPSLIFDIPLLQNIESLTDIPHLAAPATPEAQKYVSICGLVVAGIGLIYALNAGPYWNHGGKVFAQISIDGRLIFAVTAVGISLFTDHGSSLLFTLGVMDAATALLTQILAGGRRGLICRVESVSTKID